MSHRRFIRRKLGFICVYQQCNLCIYLFLLRVWFNWEVVAALRNQDNFRPIFLSKNVVLICKVFLVNNLNDLHLICIKINKFKLTHSHYKWVIEGSSSSILGFMELFLAHKLCLSTFVKLIISFYWILCIVLKWH